MWVVAPYHGLAGSEFRAFYHPPESPLFPNRFLIGNWIDLTLSIHENIVNGLAYWWWAQRSQPPAAQHRPQIRMEIIFATNSGAVKPALIPPPLKKQLHHLKKKTGPYLLLHDNTYQSNRYNLNVGLFIAVNNLSHSVLLAPAVVVGEKTRDCKY